MQRALRTECAGCIPPLFCVSRGKQFQKHYVLFVELNTFFQFYFTDCNCQFILLYKPSPVATFLELLVSIFSNYNFLQILNQYCPVYYLFQKINLCRFHYPHKFSLGVLLQCVYWAHGVSSESQLPVSSLKQNNCCAQVIYFHERRYIKKNTPRPAMNTQAINGA